MFSFDFLPPEASLVARAALNMALGGLLATYVRALYRRFSSSIGSRDSFSAVFPMLTAVTVLIIFVVKSSLALSLGLVGALSIVRFRAAIKSPEELVYLFFCIGLGVALGAEHRLLALVAVAIVTLFIVGRGRLRGRAASQSLLLTVSGSASSFFGREERELLEVLKRRASGTTIQRFDIEDGQVQFRASLSLRGLDDTTALMAELQTKLPGYQISYTNLESLA
ncbi:MAG TPA: DUF4956 domain-containing protein [Vicinamibacteria bacterium]|nr:DUF4956 domain-containing protein [Vicinamibacteria bacterium]